eukprot:m.696723 g.696723  ORF g.696723 m.696723 type:complete len:671 (-) comp22895_c0_seq7:443-2455(-)
MTLHLKTLFPVWLEEWRLEAQLRNSRTQYMYSKAIKALKTYDKELLNGTDATDVPFIGPATAARLQQKLKAYCQEKNIPCPESQHSASGTLSSDTEDVGPVSSAKTTSKSRGKRKKTAEREYIPTRRSGAYAILLTLYRQTLQDSFKGYLTKSELITLAQPSCDASFTAAKAGSYYSAWASMKTLVAKNYVLKRGNPGKFSLTDEGECLGQKLHTVEALHEDVSSMARPVSASNATASFDAPRDDGRDKRSRSHSGAGSSSDGGGGSVHHARSAVISPSATFAARNTSSSVFSPVAFKPDAKMEDLLVSDFDDVWEGDARGPPPVSHDLTALAMRARTLDPEAPMAASRRRTATGDSATAGAAAVDRANYCNSTSYALTPSEFDIVLAIDTCEHTGSRQDKGAIQQKLAAMGVRTDVRKLALGDFLWVAQERVQPVPGQLALPHQRELVLDYVIERKRMDDLASSICDGRFAEQKFRFKTTGVRHPIYLVEDYGRIDNQKLPAESLRQALINTQVHDGFFIKHTADTMSTVAYLVLLHRKITSMFSGKVLIAKGIDNDVLTRRHGPNTHVCVAFDDFMASTMKTKVLQAREMFAKQLMQMALLTANKAAAIVDIYPTPLALMKAYDRMNSFKECNELLEGVKYKAGSGERTLGPAISAKIARLYNDMALQ